MSASASVRCAALADLDRLALLFDAYRRFYGQASDIERARDWLHARLTRGESTVLIAERDDATVGFAQLYPMFSSVRTARIWILNDLYVDESTRRGGVGRALLDAAAAFAREDGAARLMLETGRDNVAARALYRAAGWSEDDSQWYSLDAESQSAA
ncbi:GNAT family N-acetyltransferase [Cognatilysobacter bugurensis]|uniref:N-acetyltransferase n=1 Tax=Cognatilysobacter bugurensis TaxID=543356 RepID=A0A918T5W0_9GAMM|nr:GNAT family N-acetyltransferase [Lysobacter bugurensis]GHA89538.1 N-acetyltransferase [Lysobacter bugurensis]